MNPQRSIRFGRVGALGALIAWALTEPYATTATAHGAVVNGVQFTYGSVFGWLGMGAFGGFVCGLLTYYLARERALPGKSRILGCIGFVVGALIGAGADAGSDLLNMRLFTHRGDTLLAGVAMECVWQVLMSGSIALAISLVSLPSWRRARKLVIGGCLAGFLAFLIKFLFVPFFLEFDLIRLGIDVSKVKTIPFYSYSSARLVEHCSIGFLVGSLLAGAETMLAVATVRWRRDDDETVEFPIFGMLNRIGSREGLEVALLGAPSVAPVHAAIQYDAGKFTLLDGNTPAGTWIDGRRVIREPLRDGDRFQLGSETLSFHIKAPAQTSDPSGSDSGALDAGGSRMWLEDAFGATIALGQGDHLVGRGPTAFIRLDYDPTVKERHALIQVEDGVARLVDYSRGETTINGVAISEASIIRDGDQLGFANVGMTFHSKSRQEIA